VVPASGGNGLPYTRGLRLVAVGPRGVERCSWACQVPGLPDTAVISRA